MRKCQHFYKNKRCVLIQNIPKLVKQYILPLLRCPGKQTFHFVHTKELTAHEKAF